MEIKDLAGLSDPLKKLIEVISQGIGAVSKPYLIRKTAEAKAYEIKVISDAFKNNQHELLKIDFESGKINIKYLDEKIMKNELSLEHRTLNRRIFQDQKKQTNIENITQKAVQNIEEEDQVSEDPVDEDWTTRFFSYAEDISNEEMQEIWAKILAGEIKNPKTYSLRTLDILRNLSPDEAQVFVKFASLSIKWGKNSFMLNLGSNPLMKNKYGLDIHDYMLLEELGLISGQKLKLTIDPTDHNPKDIGFRMGNGFVLQEKKANKPKDVFEIMVFTKVGEQLLNFVKSTPDLDYIQLVAKKLNKDNGRIQYGYIPDSSGKNGIVKVL